MNGLISKSTSLFLNISLTCCIAIIAFLPGELQSQEFIDTLYSFDSQVDIPYGNTIDFAGQTRQLRLDVSRPLEAPLPECGRPLIVIIHGGAWVAGSKDDAGIVTLREEFAKRGYVSAAINYRLGFFLTNYNQNCNVPNWNCMLAADTSEWIRAWYRGVQDARGAIRYLVANAQEYQIDPQQIFVYGESAGGFIALGIAYLDDENEKPAACSQLSSVQPPNQAYYQPCIQNASWSVEIGAMNFARPDLGPIDGYLNQNAPSYRIKAIANMFGGMMQNLFQSSDSDVPDLYSFHQPNDLIVPIGNARLLKGFSDCAASTGCISIPNRPISMGTQAITDYLNSGVLDPQSIPETQIEITSNIADCLVQVLNPSLGGHQYDAPYLRSLQAATFFAQRISNDSCNILNHISAKPSNPITLVVEGKSIQIHTSDIKSFAYQLFSIDGRLVDFGETGSGPKHQIELKAEPGLYVFRLNNGQYTASFLLPE
jgi:hypothetical protein